MPKSLLSTLGVYCVGYAALNAYAQSNSAVSKEAIDVPVAAASNIVNFSEHSQALSGKKADALSQLRALAGECMEDNWDDDGASAIELEALLNTEAFVRALPDNVPLPEFAPEPDGSISLDWIQSRQSTLSLSVGRSNRLAYAWLNGTDRGHAVVRFDGLFVPTQILALIQSIVTSGSYTNASVRVA